MKGIVHVGAHRGEEVGDYLRVGHSPIILFEPQSLNWTPPEGVILVRKALSDRTCVLPLLIPYHLDGTPDTMSASGLELIPDSARENGWIPTPTALVTVPAIRFDEWADRHNFVDGSCDTLVIDVQGMEGHVLDGFGDYLDGFERIRIELSQPPLYDGGASGAEVKAFLLTHGFHTDSPIPRHGDVWFTWRAN